MGRKRKQEVTGRYRVAPEAAVQRKPPVSRAQLRLIPHLRFVRYLILCGRTNLDVHAYLEANELEDIEDEVLEAVRVEMRVPPEFTPSDLNHAPSQEFVSRYGLTALFQGAAEAKIAMRIIRNAALRESVECDLIVGRPKKAIAAANKVSEEGVKEYARIFFDIGRLTARELDQVLHRRDPEGTSPARAAFARPPGLTAFAAALRSRRQKVDRRLMPGILEDALTTAVVSATVALDKAGLDAAREARARFSAAETIQSLLASFGPSPQEKLVEDLQKFLRIEMDKAPVPTVNELSGGQHNDPFSPDVPADVDAATDADNPPESAKG